MKKSPLLAIFLIVLIDLMGFTIILPLLPFYAESFGASPVVVGWILTSYAICQLIAGPILGRLSDRVGRKPVLMVSQCGTLAGFLLLAFAGNLPLIFLARVIDGLTAGNISVAQAYIADVTKPENRAKSFALIGIAFGCGYLVGPALAGYLSQFGHQAPIFAAAFFSLSSILATAFWLPDSRKIRDEISPLSEADSVEPVGRSLDWKVYRELFRDASLKPLLWQFSAFVSAFALFLSGFALFAERRFTHGGVPFGAREVGYVLAYGGVLGIFIQGGLTGRLVKKFGETRLVEAGFVLMAGGFILLGAASNLTFLMLSMTIAFAGISVIRPALTSLITQKGGRDRQGTVLGLTQSLMSISQILAPFLSGFLIQHRWLALWAWTGALSALWGWRILKRSQSTAKV